MNVIAAIDAARERWNVLEHPFYVRWERGELTRDELARYAGEYRHAVVALARSARTAGSAAEDELGAAAILYAVESGQPAISATKLRGLVTHYGFSAESTATAYFELHAERDHEHAAEARSTLEGSEDAHL